MACVAYILCKKLGLQVLYRCLESETSGIAGTDVAVIPPQVYLELPWHQSAGRQLGANAPNTSLDNAKNSDASSPHNSNSHESHGHPHDALFFFFMALLFGTIALHLTMIPRLHDLQQTVVLFVSGMLWSLLVEGLKLKGHLGVLGRSYDMWMEIDPNLLLFAMLPALLAGDAMNMDTSVARSVAKQCIFLAGPGVLFGSFVTAWFLYVYIPNWDFLLCLTTGSILSATDPVAVSSLLKELGAPPILTVLTQGEALLNNGMSIILYTIAYNMLSGVAYDTSDILIYIVVVAFCAVGLGIVFGWLFLQWIALACDRADHKAVLVQTALTLGCAYWSFCIAQGFLKINGVLCCVSASLLLADKMWPHVADKASMHHMWEMIEYLANTITFFLAGSLFGNTMIDMPAIDYMRLMVIYAVCTGIRGLLLISSRPILKMLSSDVHGDVSLADALAMTWGGLRGAVGLVLGIQVNLNRANGNISELDGKRVLFYVGGVATLTLVINATTCPKMITLLGITRTPTARRQMLTKIFTQLTEVMKLEHPKDAVKCSLKNILDDARQSIDSTMPLVDENSEASAGFVVHSMTSDASRPERHSFVSSPTEVTVFDEENRNPRSARLPTRVLAWLLRPSRVSPQTGLYDAEQPRLTINVCEHFESAQRLFKGLDQNDIEVLDLPAMPFASKEDDMQVFIRERAVDPNYVKSVNTAFLSLVTNQYWRQLESAEFFGGNGAAEVLLTSVSLAVKDAGSNLTDLQQLLARVRQSHADSGTESGGIDQVANMVQVVDKRVSEQIKALLQHTRPEPERKRKTVMETLISSVDSVRVLRGCKPLRSENPTQLQRILDSSVFNTFMSIILVFNAVVIVIEQSIRNEDNYHHKGWFVSEVCFTFIFVAEFSINIAVLRLGYFCDLWKLFDFVILIISLFGLAMELLASQFELDMGNEMRMMRLNRVFRVLRILRVFRLFNFFNILKAHFQHEDLSLQLAERLRTIMAFRAFIKAHIHSQIQFAELFGGQDGQFTRAEEVRVIIESQTEVYRGIAVSVLESRDIDNSILDGMHLLRDGADITQTLSNFISAVEESGVLTAIEAKSIGRPLQHHIRKLHAQIKRAINSGNTSGIQDRYPDPEPGERGQKPILSPRPLGGSQASAGPRLSWRGTSQQSKHSLDSYAFLDQESVRGSHGGRIRFASGTRDEGESACRFERHPWSQWKSENEDSTGESGDLWTSERSQSQSARGRDLEDIDETDQEGCDSQVVPPSDHDEGFYPMYVPGRTFIDD